MHTTSIDRKNIKNQDINTVTVCSHAQINTVTFTYTDKRGPRTAYCTPIKNKTIS